MWKFFSKYRKTDSWMIQVGLGRTWSFSAGSSPLSLPSWQTSLLIALAADTATVLANSAACYLYV